MKPVETFENEHENANALNEADLAQVRGGRPVGPGYPDGGPTGVNVLPGPTPPIYPFPIA